MATQNTVVALAIAIAVLHVGVRDVAVDARWRARASQRIANVRTLKRDDVRVAI